MLEKEVDNLIDVLNIKKVAPKEGRPYYRTSLGKTYQRSGLRKIIRETLGIDKQCFQCSNWFFDYELSQVEGTPSLVCQNCAEGIISGEIKLKV